MRRLRHLVFVAALVFDYVSLRAEVRCAAVFGDHMVLQRDRPVPLWGTAAAVPKPGVEVVSAVNTRLPSSVAVTLSTVNPASVLALNVNGTLTAVEPFNGIGVAIG
jgi:sialate O-acetylesterase